MTIRVEAGAPRTTVRRAIRLPQSGHSQPSTSKTRFSSSDRVSQTSRAGCRRSRGFFRLFFAWYNDEHHHSGIAMLTPATVHNGLVEQVVAKRQVALDAAYGAHPERFVAGPPVAARPPAEVWINRPTGQTADLNAEAVGLEAHDAGLETGIHRPSPKSQRK